MNRTSLVRILSLRQITMQTWSMQWRCPMFVCFTYTLNLALQATLKPPAILPLHSWIRSIAMLFHRNTKASSVLKGKQAKLNLPCHILKMDILTRWTVFWICWIRRAPPSYLRCAGFNHGLPEWKGSLHSHRSKQKMAENILKALNPVKLAMLAMSEDTSPTLSVIVPLHSQLLEDMHQHNSDTTIIKDIKFAMHDDLRLRYVYKNNFHLLNLFSEWQQIRILWIKCVCVV